MPPRRPNSGALAGRRGLDEHQSPIRVGQTRDHGWFFNGLLRAHTTERGRRPILHSSLSYLPTHESAKAARRNAEGSDGPTYARFRDRKSKGLQCVRREAKPRLQASTLEQPTNDCRCQGLRFFYACVAVARDSLRSARTSPRRRAASGRLSEGSAGVPASRIRRAAPLSDAGHAT